MEQLKTDGKHIKTLKRAVEIQHQKKVLYYHITPDWITFLFEDDSVRYISMKDYNLFELYNVLLKG